MSVLNAAGDHKLQLQLSREGGHNVGSDKVAGAVVPIGIEWTWGVLVVAYAIV